MHKPTLSVQAGIVISGSSQAAALKFLRLVECDPLRYKRFFAAMRLCKTNHILHAISIDPCSAAHRAPAWKPMETQDCQEASNSPETTAEASKTLLRKALACLRRVWCFQVAVSGSAKGKGKTGEGPPCTSRVVGPAGKSKGPPLPTFTKKPEVAKQQEPKAISAVQLIHWTFCFTGNTRGFSIITACMKSLSRWTWHHPSSWSARQTRRRAGHLVRF